MSDATIVFTVTIGALVFLIWNKLPPVIVGVGVSLTLFFTGVLTGADVLAGLGDPTVILIAGLFVVGAGLEASGVTTWAGQVLVEKSAGSPKKAFLLLMFLSALATATISVNETVAVLHPVVIIVALRLGQPTSQLLLPLCFAAHSAAMLTLLGAPLNVIASNTAMDAGYGGIGFFEFAVAGVPMFIGSVIIMLVTQRFLLPHRNGASLPANFSAHARTLVEQYRIEDGLHALRVRAASPYVGRPREAVELQDYPGLSLVAIQEGESGRALKRPTIAEGDLIRVRGEKESLARFATDMHLALCPAEDSGPVADTLFNKRSGLAEVLIPPRSEMIGQTAFPGMSTRNGDLMVLAVHRGGKDLGPAPTQLEAGDHLLMQGTWQALDRHLADPQLMVVDSPEVVRRQTIPLGYRAWEALAVLIALTVLLAGNWFPAALSAVICAVALVLLRVLTLPQVYKSIEWNTCILVGGMMSLATAMRQTGAAESIADNLILFIGEFGPRAILAGLFLVTFALTQVMSNTAAALVMLPIAAATGPEMGVSSMPLILGVTVAAHGALLTPGATPVNLMVVGPGGYKFSDYWKYGLPIGLWWLVVVVVVIPVYWKF
ncbi:MAG TPA: SLC13 family permease [Desulfobacterales bacterium]